MPSLRLAAREGHGRPTGAKPVGRRDGSSAVPVQGLGCQRAPSRPTLSWQPRPCSGHVLLHPSPGVPCPLRMAVASMAAGAHLGACPTVGCLLMDKQLGKGPQNP